MKLQQKAQVFQLQKYLCNFTNPGENNEKLVRGMSFAKKKQRKMEKNK